MPQNGDVKIENPIAVGGGSTFLNDLAKAGAGAIVNGVGSYLSMKAQSAEQRKLLDYQWNKMYSPSAQVRNLAAAGVNPAVAFGNQSPVFSSGGQLGSVDAPQFGIGTLSLTDLSTYVKNLADAKKAGADIPNIDADVRLKTIDADTKEFELSLNRVFKSPQMAAELSLAWKNVLLANDTHDINEQEKAINEWKKVSEKARAQADEHNRDILEKVLNNKDTELRLSNDILREKAKTEKSAQSANYASANASNTQAEINKEIKKLRSIEREIADTGKMDKIDEYLSELKRNKMLNDKEYEEYRAKFLSIKGRNDYGDKHEWYRGFYNILDDLETYLSKVNPLKGMFSDLH